MVSRNKRGARPPDGSILCRAGDARRQVPRQSRWSTQAQSPPRHPSREELGGVRGGRQRDPGVPRNASPPGFLLKANASLPGLWGLRGAPCVGGPAEARRGQAARSRQNRRKGWQNPRSALVRHRASCAASAGGYGRRQTDVHAPTNPRGGPADDGGRGARCTVGGARGGAGRDLRRIKMRKSLRIVTLAQTAMHMEATDCADAAHEAPSPCFSDVVRATAPIHL